MRVLFCVDGSEGSERALERGSVWLKNAGIQAVVLYVSPEVDERLRHYERLYETELREIERLFGDQGHGLEIAVKAREHLKRLGLQADRKVRQGDPAEEILAETREGRYDLVVLACDATGTVEEPRLGSVAEQVVREAPTSVLVVRAGGAHGSSAG